LVSVDRSPQDAVHFLEVLDHTLLLPVHPAGSQARGPSKLSQEYLSKSANLFLRILG